MDVWTIQLSKGKAAQKTGLIVLNTTVKNGDLTFAPSWEMVLDVKSGKITPEQYTLRYYEMMRISCRCNWPRWEEVCLMPVVAIGCFCTEGKFCHRHLLAAMFERVCEKRGIPFQLLGEWRTQPDGTLE